MSPPRPYAIDNAPLPGLRDNKIHGRRTSRFIVLLVLNNASAHIHPPSVSDNKKPGKTAYALHNQQGQERGTGGARTLMQRLTTVRTVTGRGTIDSQPAFAAR